MPSSVRMRFAALHVPRWRWSIGLALLLTIGGGLAVWQSLDGRSTFPPEITAREYEQAARELTQRYGVEPDRMAVLSWLGDAAVRNGEFEKALACYGEIPRDHRLYGSTARYQEGVALLGLNRAVEAEQRFEQFLKLAEGSPNISPALLANARERLRYIYEVQLRFEERRKVLAANIATGYFDKFDLLKYCFPGLLRWNGPQAVAWLEGFHEQDPDDFRLRVALGRYRTGQGRVQEALELLQMCCRERPRDLTAQAALLENLREQGEVQQMIDIVDRLPDPTASDPWLLLRLRGTVSNQQGSYREAVRCFRFALRSDPADVESCLGLAQAYAGLGEMTKRQEMLDKAQILAVIQNRTGRVQGTDDVDAVLDVAELCDEADLNEYARIWAWLASKTDPNSLRAKQLAARLRTEPFSSPAPLMQASPGLADL